MYKVTSKKSGEIIFCDSREEAKNFVRLFVYINNKQHYKHDNKNNYIIEEIWPIFRLSPYLGSTVPGYVWKPKKRLKVGLLILKEKKRRG